MSCTGCEVIFEILNLLILYFRHYRIFEEVLQWSVTDIRVFVENLPEEMRTLHHVSNELNARLLGKTASLKKILGFVGFVYVVATIATQVR